MKKLKLFTKIKILFFGYKCTNSRANCMYEGLEDSCMFCGLEFKQTKTIWNIIHGLVPHNARPSNVWYNIKCFFIRYTTVKPRYLPHTWVDRDFLMVATMFEILCQFLEKEVNDEEYNDTQSDRHEIYVKMAELRGWWLKYGPVMCGKHEVPIKIYARMEEEFDKELPQKLQEILEIRKFMWT